MPHYLSILIEYVKYLEKIQGRGRIGRGEVWVNFKFDPINLTDIIIFKTKFHPLLLLPLPLPLPSGINLQNKKK